MISKETVDQVLMRSDIENIVGSYVTLKRAGSNLRGLCPFHSEKSPSFTVYPQDNSFYCFGCGAGGDVITFIKKKENLDYPDAIAFLADRAGINIVLDEVDKAYSAPKFDRARMFKMNADAARYFHKSLFDQDPDSRAALAYFTEVRKLSISVIKHFGLGYAKNSFDAFSRHMLSLGYTHEELIAGFLIGRSEKGTYYDAFRNRVMFPIIDVSGNVIAFGGRVMDDSKPKYKNSSDTPVFKKSRNLFALNFAKAEAADSLILCEGYMDVIAMHAAGFTSAVATLGTAITSEQARLMSRYTKKVVISYDADEAGQKAAARAIKLLSEVGIDVTILKVPGAKDPDEYIRENGSEKFKALLTGSKTRFEYNSENILAKYDLSLSAEKVKALAELEKLISETYSSAERDIYISIIAKKLDVDPKSIKLDVEKIVQRQQRTQAKESMTKLKQDSVGYSDKVNPDFIKSPAVAKNEETILGMLLLFPEHRKKVFEEDLLSDDDFITELNRNIFSYIRECYTERQDSMIDMNERFNEDQVGRITHMKLARMSLSENGSEVLLDSIATLKNSVRKKNNEKNSSIEGLSKLIASKRMS